MVVLSFCTFWYQMYARRVNTNEYTWANKSHQIDSRIWHELTCKCDFQNDLQWTQTHNHHFPTLNTQSFKKKLVVACSKKMMRVYDQKVTLVYCTIVTSVSGVLWHVKHGTLDMIHFSFLLCLADLSSSGTPSLYCIVFLHILVL